MCCIQLIKQNGSTKRYFLANNFSIEFKDGVVEIKSYELRVKFKPIGDYIEEEISRLFPDGLACFKVEEQWEW